MPDSSKIIFFDNVVWIAPLLPAANVIEDKVERMTGHAGPHPESGAALSEQAMEQSGQDRLPGLALPSAGARQEDIDALFD